MATNIVTKAAEVRWWIESSKQPRSAEEIAAYVKQRWPNLDEDIRGRIARLASPAT